MPDVIASLRAQLATAHEALGAALELVRQQSYGAAQIVLEKALKGKKMIDPPPPPPEPEDNPDVNSTPDTIGPSQL